MIDVRCSRPFQLTFVGGEKTTEIFLQSLELGHSAATRAIKASGGHWGTLVEMVRGRWGPVRGEQGKGEREGGGVGSTRRILAPGSRGPEESRLEEGGTQGSGDTGR